MPVTIFSPGTKILSAPVNNNFAGLANGSLDTVGNSLSKTRKQTLGNFLYTSGWSIPTSANLTTTIPTFEGYVNGQYVNPGSTVVTVGASKDSYYDCKDDGSIVVTAVANGATAPAVATNSDGSASLRIGIVTSSASAITSCKTFGYDGNGAPLAPSNPLLAQQPFWTKMTYQNGWVDFDTGGAGNWGGGWYYKDSMGMVHCKGLVKSGAANSVITTFPVGYRPSANVMFMTNVNNGADTWAWMELQNTGNIWCAAGPGATTTGWVNLNNLHFRAEA